MLAQPCVVLRVWSWLTRLFSLSCLLLVLLQESCCRSRPLLTTFVFRCTNKVLATKSSSLAYQTWIADAPVFPRTKCASIADDVSHPPNLDFSRRSVCSCFTMKDDLDSDCDCVACPWRYIFPYSQDDALIIRDTKTAPTDFP